MSHSFKLYWASAYNLADLMMGEFKTLESARAGQVAAYQEMIGQGGEDDGWWAIDEYNGNGCKVATHDC